MLAWVRNRSARVATALLLSLLTATASQAAPSHADAGHDDHLTSAGLASSPSQRVGPRASGERPGRRRPSPALSGLPLGAGLPPARQPVGRNRADARSPLSRASRGVPRAAQRLPAAAQPPFAAGFSVRRLVARPLPGLQTTDFRRRSCISVRACRASAVLTAAWLLASAAAAQTGDLAHRPPGQLAVWRPGRRSDGDDRRAPPRDAGRRRRHVQFRQRPARRLSPVDPRQRVQRAADRGARGARAPSPSTSKSTRRSTTPKCCRSAPSRAASWSPTSPPRCWPARN